MITLDDKSAPALKTPGSPSQSPAGPDLAEPVDRDAVDENLYLIGRPTLKQFLRFVKTRAVRPPAEGTLVDQWQAAKAVVDVLEKDEAGAADDPSIATLDTSPENEPLLLEFLKDPLVQNGFNTVPTEVAFVELDRLVVSQHHIDLTYVPLLERELGPSPSQEQIFRVSLLHDHPTPDVKWSRLTRTTRRRETTTWSPRSRNITRWACRGM